MDNNVRLSGEAFHQQTNPIDVVRKFTPQIRDHSIPLKLQPAWLVSMEANNPYNTRTREILDSFSDMALPVGRGNVIFPAGNAKKYLADYFTDVIPGNPYVEDPYDVRCVSFDPDGNVLGGNVYRQDIMKILETYRPLQTVGEDHADL